MTETAEVDYRTFSLEDGSQYARIPASEFPVGDDWDSVEIERQLAAKIGIRSLVGPVLAQNGWTANDRSVIASFTVPGTSCRLALRAGDCSVLILDFLAWYHVNIEPIDIGQLDDWGYAERLIRGSETVVSNHAMGGAADHNALLHPLGTKTLTKGQLAKIRARIALYRGALRHGAFYTGRVDEMHVEINAGPKLVREVADDIRAGRLGGGSSIEEDFLSALSDQEQRELLSLARRIAGPADARGYDMLQSIERIGERNEAMLIGLTGDTSDGSDRMSDIWAVLMQLLAQKAGDPNSAVDVDSLAAKVVDGMGKELAAKFLAELSTKVAAAASA